MATKSRTGRGEEEEYSVKKVRYDDGTTWFGGSRSGLLIETRCFEITSR
jgi:hypothetical protein